MHFKIRIAAVVALVFLALGASPAFAAGRRTWVSSKGTDSGTCAFATPCRDFAYALTQTAPDGEIIALDSAGYGGGFTITEPVSIVAPPGIEALVSAPAGQNAITIAAGTSDKIVLRGLTIAGIGGAADGVVFNAGGNLTIIDCLIQGFSGNDNQHGNGILIQHGSGAPVIFISNTQVINNTYIGVSFIPTGSGGGTIDVDHLTASNNLIGFAIYGGYTGATIKASVTGSVTDNNTSLGLQLIGAAGGNATTVNLSNDRSYDNKNNDMYSSGNAIIQISNCAARDFQYATGSALATFGNNSIGFPYSTGGTLSHVGQF